MRPPGVVVLAVCLLLSFDAYSQVVVNPPGTTILNAYLEERTTVPGGRVRATLVPRPELAGIIPLYDGTTSTSINGNVLEVRMLYYFCSGNEFNLCLGFRTPTLEFEAPLQAGVYSVRIVYAYGHRPNEPLFPTSEEFAGTDTLTVRNPAEPIATLETWGRLALVVLLAGLTLPFVRRR